MAFARALAAALSPRLFRQWRRIRADFPDHPIAIIVLFAPGGATDAIATHHPGPDAESAWSADRRGKHRRRRRHDRAAKAARADPDGYTILIHQVALAAGMSMYSGLTFDAEKDFTTIGLINTAASTLAARPTLPANNSRSWWPDEQPGQDIKIGHPGVGSYGHLAGVLVAQELGVRAIQIAYRGAGPALVDLLGNQVDLESQSAVVSGPLVKSGKLKAYAVIGRKRFAGLPDLPTMANSLQETRHSISAPCCWRPTARRN